MNLLIILLCGFAFAIGGEKYFGKWRRGVLIFIPVAIHGLIHNMVWHYFLIQAILSYAIYQGLFYDICIKFIYPQPHEPQCVWLGRLGCIVNGMMVGLHPAVYQWYQGSISNALLFPLWLGFAFLFCVWLSNSMKISLPICIKLGEVKVFCLQDSWWFVCFIFGLSSRDRDWET